MWWLIVTHRARALPRGLRLYRAAQGRRRWRPGTDAAGRPAGNKKALQVQVIAQQWEFTYRYPQYGGVETTSS